MLKFKKNNNSGSKRLTHCDAALSAALLQLFSYRYGVLTTETFPGGFLQFVVTRAAAKEDVCSGMRKHSNCVRQGDIRSTSEVPYCSAVSRRFVPWSAGHTNLFWTRHFWHKTPIATTTRQTVSQNPEETRIYETKWHKSNVETINTWRHIAAHHVTAQRSSTACTKWDSQKRKVIRAKDNQSTLSRFLFLSEQKIISRPSADSYSYQSKR